MSCEFDKSINRWDTDSVKYDAPEIPHQKRTIPMWVADTDFQTPKPILQIIQKGVDHGVLGYTIIPDEWYSSIINWVDKRFDWEVYKEQIIFTPGIVRGIAFVLQCFTQPLDKVMVMSPVYTPFFAVTKNNNREVVYHSLKLGEEQFEVDFDQFEKDILGCKLLILCNPHNPGGRVWTKEELGKIAAICHKNNVLVISDEIHADLTLPGNTHTTYLKSCPIAKQHGIVFMSPSKAFNMAGLSSSYCIIQNPTLLKQYAEFVEALRVNTGNIFSYRTVVSAYNECEDWLVASLNYIQRNIDYVQETLAEKMPKIRCIMPQASFLIFLDCRDLNLTDKKLDEFFKEAGLILNAGVDFGKEGSGFMRMNVGCTMATLKQALSQLKTVYDRSF